MPKAVYLTYRLLVCFLWIGFFFYDLILVEDDDIQGGGQPTSEWTVFFTSWGVLLVTFGTIIRLVSALQYYTSRALGADKTMSVFVSGDIIYKVDIFVHSMYNTAAIVITTVYWGLLYANSSGPPNWLDVCEHAVNSAYTVLDLMISAYPVWILHFWIPSLLLIIYIIVNLGFWFNTGAVLYPEVMDWEGDPNRAAWQCMILLLIVIPCVQLILFSIYWLRVIACRMCTNYQLHHHLPL